MGIGNSTSSSLAVGIHIDRRPSLTRVCAAKSKISFCSASNPYGLLGAIYPGRLGQHHSSASPYQKKKSRRRKKPTSEQEHHQYKRVACRAHLSFPKPS